MEKVCSILEWIDVRIRAKVRWILAHKYRDVTDTFLCIGLVPATQQKRKSQGPSTEGGTRSKTLRINANLFTPHLTFWATTFLVVFFIVFGRIFI
jgi:hypothetical protein